MSRKSDAKHPRAQPTARMRLYATAYIETLEGTLSAELAGYSKKSAEDISKQLQRHPSVRALIDKGLDEKERDLKDKCVKAMEHSYAQATVDIADLFGADGNLLSVAKMPRDARRAIASIEVEFEEVLVKVDGQPDQMVRRPKLAKIKLHDKRASQDLFAKYAGKLKDRVELDATESYAEMVLAAQRKREGLAEPAPAEPEP